MPIWAKITISVLLLTSSCYGQAIFRAQNAAGGGSGGISPGDLITCEYEFSSGLSLVSVVDTLNGTFTFSPVTATFTDGIGEVEGITQFQNSAGGSSDTITLTVNSAHNSLTLACQAWKNAALSGANDTGTSNPGHTTTAGTTSTNPTSGNFQTTVNGDLILGVMANTGTQQGATPGNGNFIDTDPTGGFWPQYYVQSTASASTTLTYTNASDTWGELWMTPKSNGGTLVLDGNCHGLTDNGATSSTTVVLVLNCGPGLQLVNTASQNCQSSATTCVVSYSPTAGNLVITDVYSAQSGGNGVTATTDNATGGSTTYSTALASTTFSATYKLAEYYTCNVKSGVTQITENIAAGGTIQDSLIIVSEYSGNPTSLCLDSVSSRGNSVGGPAVGGTITPATGVKEVINGLFINQTNANLFTNDSPYTVLLNVQDTFNGPHVAIATQIVSSTSGTYAAQANVAGSVAWSAWTTSYK